MASICTILATITVPTLIVHGDRDPLYPSTIVLELSSSVRRSYLWIVPNGGHIPIYGETTGQFIATALPFLNGAWESRVP
jgi:pimeloyl-ACP methyl ester carboxylesterase